MPTEPDSASSSTESFFDRHWRWFVLGTLFLATFLNYLDRQTLGAAMPPIAEEFGLTNVEIGNLLSAFLWTYAAAHLFVGLVIDRVRNIRLFFPIMLIGWSATTVLAGLAQTYEQLLAARYLLGIWEAVNFPICLMIIARIFPAEERSLASGIFASGAFFATLVAPKVVIYFSNEFDWRYSFIVAGLLGFVWLVPWLLVFRDPERRAAGWKAGLAGRGRRGVLSVEEALRVLRAPAFWGVALVGVGIIPSLYFATQWLPTTLETSLGLAYDQQLGNYLLVIYLMQDAGLWLGGALVLWLSRTRLSILNARKAVIVMGYLFMLSVLLLPYQTSAALTVAVFSLFTFGIGIFLGNQHAFKQDVARTQVATVSAWVGFIEMMFTAFVVQRVGALIGERADFGPVYAVLAGLATFALLVVFVLLRPQWLELEDRAPDVPSDTSERAVAG